MKSRPDKQREPRESETPQSRPEWRKGAPNIPIRPIRLGKRDLRSKSLGISAPNPIVEDAALAWLEGLGWSVGHGLEIAPDSVALAAMARSTVLARNAVTSVSSP